MARAEKSAKAKVAAGGGSTTPTSSHGGDRYAHGALFDGKYRIEAELGRGGMGIVLSAMHLGLDERVAIKVLLPEFAEDEEKVARFEREAKAAAKIRGEHVGRVLDVGRDAETGTPYLVLEFLEGEDLGHALEVRGRLPIETAVDYVLQASEAIAQAHAVGIVHRDIKPSNLFLSKRHDGRLSVKVLDFGISKLLAQENVAITQTTDVFGSPQYMSPEQLRATREVDARTDIWALGVVLYELLTNSAPFTAASVMALGVEIVHEKPSPLRAKRPEVPVEIEHVILRCLEKRPEDRFQSVGELALALRPFATTTSGQQIADAIQHIAVPRGASGVRTVRPSGNDSDSAPTVAGAFATPPQPQQQQPQARANDIGSGPTEYDSGRLAPPSAQTSQTLGPWSTRTGKNARLFVIPAVVALAIISAVGSAIIFGRRSSTAADTLADTPSSSTSSSSTSAVSIPAETTSAVPVVATAAVTSASSATVVASASATPLTTPPTKARHAAAPSSPKSVVTPPAQQAVTTTAAAAAAAPSHAPAPAPTIERNRWAN